MLNRRKQTAVGELVRDDLEVLPLMNLFVVLIPMLLLSAVFVEMSVIRMNLPFEVATEEQNEIDGIEENLLLAVTIREEQFVIEGKMIPTTAVPRGGENERRELQAALESVAGAHPENEEIMIIAEAETKYDTIIGVMDVVRAAGLPQISLLGANHR